MVTGQLKKAKTERFQSWFVGLDHSSIYVNDYLKESIRYD